MFNMRFIVSCNLVDYNKYISTSFLYARCPNQRDGFHFQQIDGNHHLNSYMVLVI